MIGREAVLEMMNEADAVYLATADASGPRVRALVNLRRSDLYPSAACFCRGQGFTVYFTTGMSSGKIAEIRANPAVAAYYSDPRRVHGVELRGRAEILTDSELKKTLWDDGWRIYWPAGVDDPDYGIVRLRPDHAAGWWETAPFTLEL